MSEEERPLPASERKLEKARLGGFWPASPETATLVFWIWVLGGASSVWRQVQRGLIEFTHECWSFGGLLDGSPRGGQESGPVLILWHPFVPLLGWSVILVMLLTAGAVLQKGWGLHPERIRPDPSRLLPFGGRGLDAADLLGRLVVESIRVTLLAGVIGILLYSLRRGLVASTGFLTPVPLLALGFLTASPLFLIDYFVRRSSFLRSMMMSEQEQRDEARGEEGSGHVKGALADRARSRLARGRHASCLVVDGSFGALVTLFADEEKDPIISWLLEGEPLDLLRRAREDRGLMIVTFTGLGLMRRDLKPLGPAPVSLHPILARIHGLLFFDGVTRG